MILRSLVARLAGAFRPGAFGPAKFTQAALAPKELTLRELGEMLIRLDQRGFKAIPGRTIVQRGEPCKGAYLVTVAAAQPDKEPRR